MAPYLDVLWLVLLGIGLSAGMLLAVFQLPGTWLILMVALAYAWMFGFQRITWPALGCMAGLAAAAEVAEILAGVRGARRAGASSATGWAALVGGLAGMILLTPVIPIPIVGSVLGGLVGCFAGAFWVELRLHGDHRRSTHIGISAVRWRLAGMLIKVAVALTMAGIALGAAWR